MLKDMKLGTKIAGGFAIVLILTAAVGYIGFRGLSDVTTIVDKADDGNRMVKIALATRQQEKNFTIRKDQECVKKVEEQVAELNKQAAETKNKMKDATDRALMDDVAGNTGGYKSAFDRYVALAAGKDAAEKEMVAAARELQTISDVMRQQQKAQYTQVSEEGRAALEDKLWKADSANRIIKLALECRQQEKNFIMRQDQQYVKAVGEFIGEIVDLATQIRAKFKEQANKDIADKVISATQVYQRGFNAYVVLRAKQKAADDKMVESARNLLACAEEMRSDQKAQLAGLIEAGADAGIVKDKLTKADDSNRVIKLALGARRQEKNFMLRSDQEYAEKVRGHVDQVISLASDMKSRFKQQKNVVKADEVIERAKTYRETFNSFVAAQRQADQIIARAQEYKKAFNQYVEVDSQRQAADMAMVDAARELQKFANTIQVEQKAQYAAVQESAAENAADKLSKADDANRLIKWALACRQHEKNFILRGDEESLRKVHENIDNVTALGKDLESRFQNRDNKEQTRKVVAAVALYRTAFDKLVKMTADQGVAEGNMVSTARNVQEACEKSREVQKEKMASTVGFSNALMIGAAAVAIVLGSILAFVITRGITKPVNRIITDLSEGSEQVSSASAQVSAASQSLAEGASEQAAGLEETSSSLEEMASMTKRNAESAQQANTLSGEARTAADKGNEAMARMNGAIADIQKSAGETAKIIKVIDEIAFQTNLLALNAAVEAARAGEAGKGFAVVAEEVRNLAMRSAEAAKNTSAMIEESVKNSETGVNIAGEVAKMLEEITGAAGKVNDLVAEINAASQEQSQGIDQVNVAVAQMDKVTQQNAANAEESASASEELNAQAEQMNGVVGELARLVGGSATATVGTTKSTATAKHYTGTEVHPVHKPTAKAGTEGAKAKTEEAIPLNEESTATVGADFGDFGA